jgi:hypothetical protein
MKVEACIIKADLHKTSIVFHLQYNPITHEPLHAQNNKPNGNIEFLQSYPTVAADTQHKIGTTIISAVLLLNEHLSRQTLPVSQNFISWCIILFSTSLSGYALLSASQIAADDFDVK